MSPNIEHQLNIFNSLIDYLYNLCVLIREKTILKKTWRKLKNIGIGKSKQLAQHQVHVNDLYRKFVKFDVPECLTRL